MAVIKIPYGREELKLEVEPERLKAILKPESQSGEPKRPEQDIVRQALAEPIASARLADMAAKSRHVLLITSDHTRPLPSKITLPILLEEIRRHNPDVRIKILVATGFHRLTRQEELIGKFGKELCKKEDIIVHDSRDRNHLVFKGKLPSGGDLWLNDLVDWADLIAAEGFIEPHFFAGFPAAARAFCPALPAPKQCWQITALLLSPATMPGQATWKTIRYIRICSLPQKKRAWFLSLMLPSMRTKRSSAPSPAILIRRTGRAASLSAAGQLSNANQPIL